MSPANSLETYDRGVMALTDAEIKKARPKAARYMKSDGSGLSLDILPSGKMSWLYRYRLDGATEKVILGRYPDLTLKAAREKRSELAAMVASGRSPAKERKQALAGGEATVESFGQRFYREQVTKNRKNPADILRYLTAEINPTLGQKLLKEVTVLDVQALVYRKRDHGRIAAAIAIRRVLKQLFDYALELQLVPMNPATQVASRYIGKARKRSRVLSAKEIRLYLRTIYQSNMRRQFKLSLHILLLTMARKSELLLARWENVNLDAGEWLVPPTNAKNGKPHIVYLSSQAVKMFRELRALAGDSELVLPGRNSSKRPFAANALNKALDGLTFEMDPLTIHDLRRTGATLLTENRFDKDVIEKALNHTREGIRAVYIVAEHAEERKRMLQWWADYVDGLVNESKVLTGNFGNVSA